MPSLSLIPQNGLNNPYTKKRDLIGEMLAGANVAPNGQKTYSGSQLMPLVNKNVTGQPTALPNINLVPTGVVFPSTKSNKGAGLAKIANIIPKEETPATNPKVKEYLTQKYSSKTTSKGEAPKAEDKPNLPLKQEIDLEKGEDQANERLSRILALVGGTAQAYGQGLLGQGTLGATQNMSQNFNTIKEREQETNFTNPKSRESVHARNLAKQLYGQDYKVDPNLTAQQFRESSPMLDNLYSRTFKQQESEKDRAFKEKQFNSENTKDWARINMQKESMGMRSSGGGGGGTSSGRASGASGKMSAAESKREYDKNAQNAGLNMMKDQVDDYFNTIKKIKPLGKTFNQSEAVEAQAKKAMAINTFKDTYKLGTLDAGLIEHMDRILGDTSYTTDKNIEARKKSVLQELERQNKQLSGAYDGPNFKFQSGGNRQQSNVIESAPQGMVEVLDASGNTRAISREALAEMPKGWRKK